MMLITNISNKASLKLTHFADDTSILITDKFINESVSNLDTINSFISWFDKNRPINNKYKSMALDFHNKLKKNTVFPDIILIDVQITYAPKAKFLRVWLNHNLN